MSKYFKLDEFKCKCCGKAPMDEKLLENLDKVREEFGKPITVTSGYRCEKRNKEIGGALKSQHILGKAADIKGDDLDKLYEICEKHFKAVGDGRPKGFVHVDTREDKVRRWNY
jgi:uncharacterized protein YcbK (DUF882 family)